VSQLKQAIADATKVAMKARDKARVAALRLVGAEIKRVEVDERVDALTDEQVVDVLNRMLKQRKDSLQQFTDAKRMDLAEKEQFEIDVIGDFMPEPLSAEALEAAIAQAIAETGASSPKDMGKVMGKLREPLKGKADMGAVSARVKALLNA
tara:strand:+ start:1316 stop:1768 length:453 start_codon:yes stop_codon:yes gene_type:complete